MKLGTGLLSENVTVAAFHANMAATHCVKEKKMREFMCAYALITHALLMNHLDDKPINLIT